MLVRDIIRESRMSELDADVSDLLISAKANNAESVPTNTLVDQLVKMGHGISAATLVSFLQGHPLVQTATMSNIDFKNTEMYAVSGDDDAKQENKDRVSSLAKKAAAKSIKQ